MTGYVDIRLHVLLLLFLDGAITVIAEHEKQNKK